MTQRTRQEIEHEVDELAVEIMDYDEDLTIEAARALIYEEVPEIYEEYLASSPEPVQHSVVKSDREPTLGEEIHEAVKKQAADRAWTQWPTKSLEELEWEVWQSDEGRQLYELYRSELGRRPISEIEQHVAKGVKANDAWRVFQNWRGG